MKTGAHILDLVLAGALGCVSVPLHAAELGSPAKLKPMQAVSLDQGDKQIVGYFVNDGGVCNLALMISDSPNGSQAVPAPNPSRVVVDIASGRSARIDSSTARTLNFSCEDGARSMNVTESGRAASDSRS